MTSRADVETDLASRLGAEREARWMVQEVVGRAAPPSAPVGDDARRALDAMARRRERGEPLQYVLGTWAFRTLELAVDERALIPRPETEHLVDVALGELSSSATGAPPAVGTVLAADLGTGTGAVALSLAAELGAGVSVWASDVDAGALALAGENRARVARDRPWVAGTVHLVEGSWFDALPDSLRGRLDLVVSNPPYVSAGEWPALHAEVRREPYVALVARDGSDGTPGFAGVEAVVAGARAWLREGGVLAVELAPHQAGAAVALATGLGYRGARAAADLTGRDRVLVARR